jgi:hypothetical protein
MVLYRWWNGTVVGMLKYSEKKLGTAVAQWLRRCAKNRKFAGSILYGVIGILT